MIKTNGYNERARLSPRAFAFAKNENDKFQLLLMCFRRNSSLIASPKMPLNISMFRSRREKNFLALFFRLLLLLSSLSTISKSALVTKSMHPKKSESYSWLNSNEPATLWQNPLLPSLNIPPTQQQQQQPWKRAF